MKRFASGFHVESFTAAEFKIEAGACQPVDTPACRSYVVLITLLREELSYGIGNMDTV
jgi:hypothetical protein